MNTSDTIASEPLKIRPLMSTNHWNVLVIPSHPNCEGKSTKKALINKAIDPVITTGIVAMNESLNATKCF